MKANVFQTAPEKKKKSKPNVKHIEASQQGQKYKKNGERWRDQSPSVARGTNH